MESFLPAASLKNKLVSHCFPWGKDLLNVGIRNIDDL